MKRKFVTNLALLLTLNILIKPLYIFGIDLGVQNTVGEAEYGVYYALIKFTFILNILLDFGIENFSRREIARHQNLLGKYLSNFVTIKLFLGFFYFIVCAVIGLVMGYNFVQLKLLSIILVNQFLASFILFLRANLGGLHLFKIDSFISILDKALMIIICGFLLISPDTKGNFKIEWFVYAQAASYIITVLITFGIVLSKADFFRIHFDRAIYFSLLRQSFPYATLIFLMAAYMHMNPLILERLLPHGAEQAGIFAQSYRIVEAFANYGHLFAILLLPIFSKMLKQKENISQLTQLSFLLIFIPALTLTISCFFFKTEIIDALYNKHLESSVSVFGIVIFSFLGICASYIFGTLLTANGNLRHLNIMAATGVAINLLLNFILIPRYQVVGSAAANLITLTYTAIYQLILATRIFKFTVNKRLILLLTIYIAGLVLLNKLFLVFLNIPWFYSFVLINATGIMFAALIRIISIKALFNIFRYNEIEENLPIE